MSEPRFSGVVVAGNQRKRAARALASLTAQEGVTEVEIILVDRAEDPADLPGSDHPSVRIVRVAKDTSFAAARVTAVKLARSPYVGFLEEHCRARQGWFRALLRAHESGPWAAVGGEVHHGNGSFGISRLIGIMNYYQWLAPTPSGERTLLPGHNSSFRRDVLLSYGGELETLMRADVAFFQKLVADGHRLYLESDAKFEHLNETRLLSIAKGYFYWHRGYGVERAAVHRWSFAKRAFYVVATPLIPFYFLAKLALRLRAIRPDLLGQALRGTPQILFAQLASASGQAIGLLFGPGDGETRFSDYELNEHRDFDPREA
ncbi:MAG: glycosyltransferase [Acidobacteria bacterium]|nr:glycosyltransferase [Acidobacteriota bacterium]